jgi:hypothetical protein
MEFAFLRQLPNVTVKAVRENLDAVALCVLPEATAALTADGGPIAFWCEQTPHATHTRSYSCHSYRCEPPLAGRRRLAPGVGLLRSRDHFDELFVDVLSVSAKELYVLRTLFGTRPG